MEKNDYSPLINLAFEEDQIYNDVTTKAIFSPEEDTLVKIVSKEKCIIAGLEVAQAVFEKINPKLNVKTLCKDGEELKQNQIIMSIQGEIHSIFSAERTALNFLSIISGIATQSRHIAQKLSKWGIKLLDTRKTIPGFRMLSKYAVTIGGGENHRFHLGSQGLVKDNHIVAHGGLRNAVLIFKKKNPNLFCQVEVENTVQLEEALMVQPDGILLDNMQPRMLKKSAKHIKKNIKKKRKKILIEASGNYNLQNIKNLRNTAIDYVSMSSVTMDAKPVNFSLEVHQSNESSI